MVRQNRGKSQPVVRSQNVIGRSRLLDGSEAYLHAVIDNFSRRILAWTLEERLGAGRKCRILLEAGRHLSTHPVETP